MQANQVVLLSELKLSSSLNIALVEVLNEHPPKPLGGLAMAVPGELRGLELAWQKHGVLPWSQLFEPAASIAEEGFVVSKILANAIKSKEEYLLSGNFSGLQ